MADLDFAALRALADAATPGPWVEGNHEIGSTTSVIAPPLSDFRPNVWEVAERVLGRDAKFIAAAREAVPALLDMRDAVLALHPIEPWGRGGVGCLKCLTLGPCATARACGVTA